MAAFIGFVLENFTLSFFVIGLVFAAAPLLVRRGMPTADIVIEQLLRWFLFFSIGCSFLYNFVMHVFFAGMAAHFIGWANSPFQYEVGFASLGFALVGFFAFRGGPGFRTAAVLGPAGFLWGAAGGHVYQMIVARNFSPGNAGVIFWTDILIPFAGFVLLYLQRRSRPF